MKIRTNKFAAAALATTLAFGVAACEGGDTGDAVQDVEDSAETAENEADQELEAGTDTAESEMDEEVTEE